MYLFYISCYKVGRLYEQSIEDKFHNAQCTLNKYLDE